MLEQTVIYEASVSSAQPVETETLVVRAPRGAQTALERAAILARLSPAALLERFVVDGLRASGFELPDVAANR